MASGARVGGTVVDVGLLEILKILVVKSWRLLCHEEEICALLEAEARQGRSEQSLNLWPGPCFPSLNGSSCAAPVVIYRLVVGLETQVIVVGVVPVSPFMVYHPHFCLQLGYMLDILWLISVAYSFAVLQLHLPMASTLALLLSLFFLFLNISLFQTTCPN